MIAAVEMCLELISDFTEVVSSIPDKVEINSHPDLPPILACGDKTIASTALAMLQVRFYCYIYIKCGKNMCDNACTYVLSGIL